MKRETIVPVVRLRIAGRMEIIEMFPHRTVADPVDRGAAPPEGPRGSAASMPPDIGCRDRAIVVASR